MSTATPSSTAPPGIAVNSTGHSHPDVVRAIEEQAKRFLHMSGTDFYYEPQVRLAEELAAVTPIDGGVRSFFGNSGTEAIEAALKLARYATGRPNIIAFFGGFHGRTMGALALTASKVVQRRGFGPFMPGVFHAPYADCYRCPLSLKPESCAAECLDFIDHQLLAHLVSPDEVAAILVEPIQGEGGYVVAPDVFMKRLRELTAEHGMLLIADEVQSGMGRTGAMFAIEHTGVRPDVIAIAKGIASGLPLGVTVARADLMTWPPGTHASTFGGNPVSCAAALATIKLLREHLVTNAAEVGAHLMNGLDVAQGQASAHRRRPRARPDDRRRTGQGPDDERARHHRARRRRVGGVQARPADPRRRQERHPLLATPHPHQRAGRRRGADLRRGAD